LMMAQMFGTLHRDQMDLVRDELTRLRQVNQDLTVLQAELAGRSPGAALLPSSAAPGAGDASAAMNDTLTRIEPCPGQFPRPAHPPTGLGWSPSRIKQRRRRLRATGHTQRSVVDQRRRSASPPRLTPAVRLMTPFMRS